MFTGVHLKNFKSWRDTGPIRLAPITAVLGSNSSGKTSLLQSLLLLRQTTESADRNRVLDLGGPNTAVDLGTYQDIVFSHADQAVITFQLRWEAEAAVTVRDPLKRARKVSSGITSRDLAFETSIHVERNKAQVERTTYTLGGARFELAQRDDRKYDLTSEEFQLVRTPGRAWPLPAPSKFYSFPDEVKAYYQNAGFLADLELNLEEALQRIRYLGPLREVPSRQYIFSGGAPSDVGRRGELAVEALIAARLSGEKRSRGWTSGASKKRRPGITIEQLIAEWLLELELISSFELQSVDDRETLYRVRVRRSPGSVPVLLTDVGFGISQVLPVLVLLAYAKPGDTVVLEQPEIHLHPAVQAGLADIILETALARRVQVILETHSEHLLTRLQRRIAEQDLPRGLRVESDDVALYFCDQVNGESALTELDLDLFGNILNWPPDFFGNPLADSVAMMEARARRLAKGSDL